MAMLYTEKCLLTWSSYNALIRITNSMIDLVTISSCECRGMAAAVFLFSKTKGRYENSLRTTGLKLIVDVITNMAISLPITV